MLRFDCNLVYLISKIEVDLRRRVKKSTEIFFLLCRSRAALASKLISL